VPQGKFMPIPPHPPPHLPALPTNTVRCSIEWQQWAAVSLAESASHSSPFAWKCVTTAITSVPNVGRRLPSVHMTAQYNSLRPILP
jgi:hypothetical protein